MVFVLRETCHHVITCIGKSCSLVRKVKSGTFKTPTSGHRIHADFRWRRFQELADEVKQVFLRHFLHGFVVIAINLYVRHIFDWRLVPLRPLAHLVQELSALRSLAASVQDSPVRPHLPSTRLTSLGRIGLAEHACDEIQQFPGRVHILNSARLHFVDETLVGTVLALEGDRSVGDFHVSIAEW